MIDLNREQFERLPEIAIILKGNDCRFLGDGYRVYGDNELQCYVDGAWYAFQEQQKKIDNINKLIDRLYSANEDSEIKSIIDGWDY